MASARVAAKFIRIPGKTLDKEIANACATLSMSSTTRADF